MLSTFAAVCFGMALAAASFVTVDVSATRDLIRDNLHSQAEGIAHNFEAALEFDDTLAAEEDLLHFRDQPNILRAAVYKISTADESVASKQKIFATYHRDAEKSPFPDIADTFENHWGDSTAWAIRPIMAGDIVTGAVFLERDLADLENRFKRYAWMVFGVAAVGVFVTMIGAIWFQGFLTRPILELSKAAHQVARKKDYSTRARRFSDDELGDLTDVFNDMLSTIEEANQVLRESHGQMEKRVEKRTRELTSANRKLVEEARERERAEDELLDAHRRLLLQEKLATVGQFSANVAHELRNPLGAIQQSLYFLNGKLPTNKKVHEHIDLIENELLHADEIITGLLEMTRDKKLSRTNIDLANRVGEVAKYSRLPEKISLDTDVAESPFFVNADPILLKQVFINLFANAQQAMPEGGSLSVKGTHSRDGKTVIIVSDTGHGIDDEDMPKIFDALHTTRTDGIGLGLSLCRDILQRHDGSILVESSLAKGAIVTITLPVKKHDRDKKITTKAENDFAVAANQAG